ncbi:MAG: phospho-N-acetylmuramoyl-pentapeptide-transferase [Clostridia bacterium]|nr:phospho-N-acetylmuramoyl-pentapeptide-transferase [Clostridia bacterium]MBR2391396.1 phospho-N-acetylmuramoyl-pentapeptide-transferase [Clostridia bacterium]
MGDVCLIIESFVFAFLVTLVISPFVISMIKREKIKQVILNYVEAHSGKSGTPTMGGIIFLISISIVSMICFKAESSLAKMTILIFLAYGVVGFLDDFIKFKFKRNLGLRAYQKIVFQLAISLIVGFFVYYSNLVGSTLVVPFSNRMIDIGWGIIPLVSIVYLASTNAVNLTDGLDGLASSTTFSYMLSFVALMVVLLVSGFAGANEIVLDETKNLMLVAAVTAGAMLSFLIFNCFPAKIFMGDTGSLALGSLVASVAVFSKTSLYIPILGIMFVLSAVSVMLQVAYYKLTKRRIFLMAPLHHHFEKKGVHEVRITICYAFVTVIVGVVVVLLNIL